MEALRPAGSTRSSRGTVRTSLRCEGERKRSLDKGKPLEERDAVGSPEIDDRVAVARSILELVGQALAGLDEDFDANVGIALFDTSYVGRARHRGHVTVVESASYAARREP